MADNFYYDPGTTEGKETGGADDIAGVKYPRVKIIVGADGTNDGDVASGNPMPVSDAGGSLTVDGTVAVTDLATLATASKQDLAKGVLDTIDADTGAIATDIAALEVLQTTIAGDTTSIDGKITACDTGSIAGTVTANAGADLNTSALALEAGGNLAAAATDLAAIEVLETTIAGDTTSIDGKITACDTGDVTVSSSALPTGAATSAKQGIAGTDLVGGAGAVAAGVQRVTLASDDPAVTDLAALEVLATSIEADTDAMVTDLAAMEVLLGTIDADTDAIKTAVETIDNAISGAEMQVDVVAPLPAGTNAIGKLAANSGVDIGDVDVTSFTSGKTIKRAAISAASSGDNTLVAAVADKKIKVLSVLLVAADEVTVRFESGASGTALTGVMSLAANAGFVLPAPADPSNHWFETGVNTLLNLELGGAVQVSGVLSYYEEA
jgi:hypothetical protein